MNQSIDHFQRLGLPRQYLLDAAVLEREYLQRSREVHPDHHRLGSSTEQRASLEASSLLNEAYTVLRDPFRRAEYLLQLADGPSAAQVKEMPLPFLEEVMELRMAIEEAKTSATAPTGLENLERQLTQRRDRLLKEVGQKLDRDPEAGGKADLLRECRQLLNATKYVQGLLRDVRDV